MPVEHGAVHRSEGIAGDDGGLDGEFLDVRLGLLQRKHETLHLALVWFYAHLLIFLTSRVSSSQQSWTSP